MNCFQLSIVSWASFMQNVIQVVVAAAIATITEELCVAAPPKQRSLFFFEPLAGKL